MFGANHSKLKTNLKLAIQRLKLLERKKSENARKSTKEIADYIQLSKPFTRLNMTLNILITLRVFLHF